MHIHILTTIVVEMINPGAREQPGQKKGNSFQEGEVVTNGDYYQHFHSTLQSFPIDEGKPSSQKTFKH